MSALLSPLHAIGFSGYHLSRFCHYSGLSHPLVEMGMRALPLAMVPLEIARFAHSSRSLLQGTAQKKKATFLKATHSGFIIAWALSAAFNIGNALSPKLYSAVNLLHSPLAIAQYDNYNRAIRAKLNSEMNRKNLSEEEKKEILKSVFLFGLTLMSLVKLTDLPILEPYFFPRINSGFILLTAPIQLFFEVAPIQ